jgi:autotransporter-associated beta strand protein
LWRIDLGINIRAGAHYTQFMVYDLDGDGRAEIACRTAPGTLDGQGDPVLLAGHSASADYRNSSGYILTGPEYLTVFDGLTGAELATTSFLPDRVSASQWGDGYGNRVDRFLAGIAYLDGVRPSLIMARGYYGPQSSGGQARNEITAWNWRDGQISMLWWFKAGRNINGNINGGYIGQGNHQLSISDVDGDGKDEIIYGACSIDDNGTGLYTTGLHHGDALHVSDMDPDRPGIEVWDVHEVASSAGGGELRDAWSGELIWGIPGSGDTGRGLAAHIDGAHPGYQMWSSATAGVLDRFGEIISGNKPSINFVVWWDGDLQRELLDNAGGGGASTKLDKWTGDGADRFLSPYSVDDGARNNNGTKSNPCLSGDILGDWREEMIFRNSNNDELMIFVSPHPATGRFRTLLHDSQYRVALAWQNVAYNQPPHPGFYVGAGMSEPAPYLFSDADLTWVGDGGANAWNATGANNWRTNGVWTNFSRTTFAQGRGVLFDLTGSNNTAVALSGTLQPGSIKVQSPTDYTFAGAGSLAGTMSLTKAGTGTLTVNTTNSFSGPTVVWEGGLIVNGRLAQSPVTVKRSLWLDSHVGGTGVFGGGVTVESASGISPGAVAGAAGTLTISNALIETGGAVNHFDLSNDPSGSSNDLIIVEGDLVLSGLNRIRINPLDGSLAYGTYELIRYSGNLSGSLARLTVDALPGYAFVLSNPAGRVLVTVSEARIPSPVTFVGGSSVWRFRDDAVDLGVLWRTNSYDDGGWASGLPELGFGDGDETTLVTHNDQWTTYFRHSFDVPAAHLVESLTVRLKRDDGAVIYLNGVEVWLSNMPQGEILYSTPAASTVAGGDESTWYSTAISPSVLRDGLNLLAVEVHQIGLSSSDITFDLELSGMVYPPDPQVIDSVVYSEGGLVISGSGGTPGGSYVVLSSTNLALPLAQWTAVSSNSFDGSGGFAFTNAVDAELEHEYFRIVVP